MQSEKPRVLCVDDERQVLDDLRQKLGRGYTVHTALGGARGLGALEREGPFVAVLADMRMPGMSGAQFLGQVRQRAPDTVRILLTGHSEISAAIAALTNGGIFRFLMKPSPRERLVATVDEAYRIYRLTGIEHELLAETVQGSVRALSELLAVTSPRAFGRAVRVERVVSAVGARLGIFPRWQLEVAALLSQAGCVSLPDDTLARYLDARPLTETDRQSLQRVPKITDDLLAGIPRLEGVRDIITVALTTPATNLRLTPPEQAATVRLSAEVLGAALALDRMDGLGVERASSLLRLRRGFGGEVIDALAAYADEQPEQMSQLITTSQLRVGMLLGEDVHSTAGELLVARGVEVTQSLLLRLLGQPGLAQEPLAVVVPGQEARASA